MINIDKLIYGFVGFIDQVCFMYTVFHTVCMITGAKWLGHMNSMIALLVRAEAIGQLVKANVLAISRKW